MIRRRIVRAVALSCGVVALSAGCGVIRIIPPEGMGGGHEGVPTPTAWVSSCAVLDQAEVESVAGGPVTPPELFLGTTNDNRYGNSCTWEHEKRASVTTWVDGSTHGPDSNGDDDYAAKFENIEGIGRTAAGGPDGPNSYYLQSHTADGLGFSVLVGRVDTPGAELKTRAMQLARLMEPRLEAAYPGDPGALPAAPTTAPNPCLLLPKAERIAVTGWVSIRDDGDPLDENPEPFVGGPLGGGAQCYFADTKFRAGLHLSISEKAVPLEHVAGQGQPLGAALPRPAVYGPPLSEADAPTFGARAATLHASLSDGRLLRLRLRDPDRDEATHRQQLIELARLALQNIGGT